MCTRRTRPERLYTLLKLMMQPMSKWLSKLGEEWNELITQLMAEPYSCYSAINLDDDDDDDACAGDHNLEDYHGDDYDSDDGGAAATGGGGGGMIL